MDVISYLKAKAVDDRLTQAINAGNNPAGWAAERDAINAKLSDQNKQSQVLKHGTQVINATMDSPVEVDIQGRTLVSLGQSNLQNTKTYVLADKKTKIKVDGSYSTQITGVAKFTKTIPTTQKANYSNKVAASIVENPHFVKNVGGSTVIQPPGAGGWIEVSQASYDLMKTLDAGVSNTNNAVSGTISQRLFSFNIIEEVERRVGRIPKLTLAEKVQWCKDNLSSLVLNWHGYGSSVGGNGASVDWWRASNSTWGGSPSNHANGSVSKLSKTLDSAAGNIVNSIDSNGFVHMVAYTAASDGVTPSNLSTDFAELEITFAATAVLDTRPIYTRVANFEGKVSGSTLEVPHLAKFAGASSTLLAPSVFTGEAPAVYPLISSLNAQNAAMASQLANGLVAQQLFSFDIIAEIERNIGRIPKATLADRVQWCKDNISKLTGNWYGTGSSAGGNKASLGRWNGGNWGSTPPTHSSSSISKLFISGADAGNIDSNGFMHYLAFAEPSDGVTASTINTDYVELEIELKPEAVLHDPIVPLYEVDATEYTNILVTWNETEVLTRYPRVQGVQHLQNPYVVAEGDNLLPGLNSGTWSISQNPTYDDRTVSFLPIGQYSQQLSDFISVLPNTIYTVSASQADGNGAFMGVNIHDSSKIMVSSINSTSNGLVHTFTTPSNCYFVRIALSTRATSAFNTVTFKDVILTLGSTAKLFTPRNPSYLFAQTKLGQIGSIKDTLYKNDGQWFKRKFIEKDMVLDGSLAWTFAQDYTGFKRFTVALTPSYVSGSEGYLTKYDGKKLRLDNLYSGFDGYYLHSDGSIKIMIADVDTGMGETYTPTSQEIQAHFNGWQAKTVDGNGKPTAWRSLGDTTDAPTQTLAYVSTNKAPNFTPYKLSYVLAAPQLVSVNVEGELSVNSPTQVEVGSGAIIREKINGFYVDSNGIANFARTDNVPSQLKYRNLDILKVYKNGQPISIAKQFSPLNIPQGKFFVQLAKSDYEATSEYTVSYLVLDREKFTNNALEVKGAYDTSLKSVVNTLVERQADLITTGSVNVQAIAELYKRVKALGG